MQIFEANNPEEVADKLIQMVEKQEQKKVFTVRVGDNEEEKLDILIVFEDKSIIQGFISITDIDGKPGARIQANYI